MSVSVTITDLKDNASDEYDAACKLKDILKNTLPPSIEGEIAILSNVTLFGQKSKDFDIVMIGEFDNYSKNFRIKFDNFDKSVENVFVRSFITTIELKSQPADMVRLEGNDFYVKYKSGWHNVTEQSESQKYSMLNYIEEKIGVRPFITNLIWFNNLLPEDIINLSGYEDYMFKTNCLPSIFSFDNLMQELLTQKNFKSGNKYNIFDSNNTGYTNNNIKNIISSFTKIKSTMGVLTRKKVESITAAKLKLYKSNDENKLQVYRGKAGSGKTANLINKAVYLSYEYDSRVLILTYNNALVSDIKRLFSFAEIPDLFDDKTVYPTTLHKYFYHLINKVLYENKLNSDMFVKNYKKYLDEFMEFISDDESVEEIKKSISNYDELNWNYIFIDEAQDVSREESEIIRRLYKPKNIMVSDGGQQYVRNIDVFDWNLLNNKINIKLKECIRQKSNLVNFNNYLNKKIIFEYPKIASNENMVGGKTIIISNKEKFYEVFNKEKKKSQKIGNSNYDILFLVPSFMVKKENGEKSFIYKNEFKFNNINVWDGTNDECRSKYPPSDNYPRLYQYESCRGLEGWIVVCLGLDAFIEEKMKDFKYDTESLLFESKDMQMRKFAINWLSMALTRAIDTNIIVLHSENSKLSKIIYEIYKDHTDYIEWIR